MSRQLDVKAEERETARRLELVKALEFGIVGALESQGMVLKGLAFRYEPFNCLLTIKATIDDRALVAFIGSDTFVNCILKCQDSARSESLKWRVDQYAKSSP
jgi:hypothetical protein